MVIPVDPLALLTGNNSMISICYFCLQEFIVRVQRGELKENSWIVSTLPVTEMTKDYCMNVALPEAYLVGDPQFAVRFKTPVITSKMYK